MRWLKEKKCTNCEALRHMGESDRHKINHLMNELDYYKQLSDDISCRVFASPDDEHLLELQKRARGHADAMHPR